MKGREMDNIERMGEKIKSLGEQLAVSYLMLLNPWLAEAVRIEAQLNWIAREYGIPLDELVKQVRQASEGGLLEYRHAVAIVQERLLIQRLAGFVAAAMTHVEPILTIDAKAGARSRSRADLAEKRRALRGKGRRSAPDGQHIGVKYNPKKG